MQFRFTLNNSIKGSHEISEPDGWKEIKIKLERDQEYHSLVEVIDVPVIFYGDNGVEDGGFDYVKDAETTQGVDALVELLIEVSDDGGLTYDEFFDGLLLLDTIKEISDAEAYKLECNVVRSDLWSKFKNRLETPVNLEAEEDLDGGVRTKIEPTRLPLPSQVIRESFLRSTDYNNQNNDLFDRFTQSCNSSTNYYLIFDNANIVADEIKERFEYGTQISDIIPTDVSKYLLKAKYSGTYNVDILIRYSLVSSVANNSFNVTWYFVTRVSGVLSTPIAFHTKSGVADSSLNGLGNFYFEDTNETSYNIDFDLNQGDELYIYGLMTIGGNADITYWADYDLDKGGGFSPRYTNLNIISDTTFEETETESYLIKDAAESILSKIVGRDNVLSSDFLGDTTPVSCGKDFAIMRGLHVRGYDFLEKPFFLSFQEWWAGANPILNLGLGYETIGGTEFIRIEDKAHFYDSDISVYFDNVDKLERIYDKDYIFKSIEIGYERWSAESASGIDDPQTKRKYNTRFKIIGRDLKILSKWVAASLAIEQTRRNRVELGKDWRMDEDIMVIAVNDDSSPIQPEFDEDFTDIVNLLNSDARYNIRLSVARNFERWKAFFNGCLQTYVDNSPCEYFKFASGEGNYDMVTTGDTCDPGRLGESHDICVTNDFYHSPQYYRFTYPMTWDDYKTIRNNRNKAIAVSATDTDHKTCFIKSLEFDHFNGTAEIEAWIKE